MDVIPEINSRNFLVMLEKAGLRIRNRRADCPLCTGGSRLTVSINEAKGVAFCHRCHASWNANTLAREQGIDLPRRRRGMAAAMKTAFYDWLADLYQQRADLERDLHKKALLAHRVLLKWPDTPEAWEALRRLADAEHDLAVFFENAQDRIGRLAIYKAWRRKSS